MLMEYTKAVTFVFAPSLLLGRDMSRHKTCASSDHYRVQTRLKNIAAEITKRTVFFSQATSS